MGIKDLLEDAASDGYRRGEGGRFDPDDIWLETASREDQLSAMREWFLARYEDPAEQTPYSSEEGDYIFVWGGPYDPNDVIQARFGDVVEYDVMEDLIRELWTDVGYKWAPKDHEGIDYDDALSMLVLHRTDPLRMLSDRLAQIEGILTLSGNPQAFQLATQLAHGAVVTALESYLWDTVAYWAMTDEQTLRAIVSTNKDFQSKTLSLSSLFVRLEGIKDEVKTYLQDLIWHRLDKVKPIVESGLGVRFPEIGELMSEVLIRHDIVHRGGRTKEGEPVVLTSGHVQRVIRAVRKFSEDLEDELNRRFPDLDDWDEGLPF